MKKINCLYSVIAVSFLIISNLLYGQKPSSLWNGRTLVIADPDIRISYDGDVVHMESYIAASEKNPDLLFACSELIVPGRDLSAAEARLYYSADAGARWNPVLLPNEISGGWDNAVAAGPGMLYFLTSNLQNGFTVYYSPDEGKNWKYTVIERTKGWDRPHMIADNTNGPHRGRLYIAGETGKGLAVISSSDGGVTFSSPVIACASTSELNMATTASPMVMSDGTLIISCAPYPNYPARASWRDAEIGLLSSNDGGQTFSSYKKAVTVHRSLPKEYFVSRARGHVLLTGNFMQGPSFAVSPAGTAFADRIYALWQDIDSMGRSQMMFAWSADKGNNWNVQPVTESSASKKVHEASPMIAVNHEGVVGIAWLNDVLAANFDGYDVFFTASIDGGVTFLPVKKISSSTSQPSKQGPNTLPSFTAGKSSAGGERNISMVSPFSTRSAGGDYATMTADAAGRFHPLWQESRGGRAWQLYTATIRVMPEQRLQSLIDKKSISDNRFCILDDRIQVLFGEPEWNKEGTEVLVPVRLWNASSVVLFEPIDVKIFGAMLSSGRARTYASEVVLPKFFDAGSSAFIDSTRITYPLSVQSPLFPNGVTSPFNLRMRIASAAWVDFGMKAVVSGGGCLLVK
ncbi:MAG TPA: hypothetical protein VHM26_05110 [Chitinophagaceae bacterium]|nr:hypothetical protein [Chitinophagaceae bacterium]